ncbi:hypothetical protein BSLA_03r1240 [Burkholderia stabilis]|nr:hypothetical protein BSLA_03r1240 [Burkholderia stabilis]
MNPFAFAGRVPHRPASIAPQISTRIGAAATAVFATKAMKWLH